jgi:hypothetical protein
MRINDAGYLGIGTTTPGDKLSVVGTTNREFARVESTFASSGSEAGLRIKTAGTNGKEYLLFNANSDGSLRVFDATAGSERMRIDSSGNLLVGTTSAINSAKQTIAYFSGSNGLTISTTDDLSATDFAIFRANSATCGVISRVGTTSAVVYTATSDHRLKTVVGAVSGQGARIDALEPIEYTWNSNGLRTRGFLAHKFQEVYADSVTGTKDAVDADGNPVYQAMQASSSEVIADLVAEIQSLRQRLAAAGI